MLSQVRSKLWLPAIAVIAVCALAPTQPSEAVQKKPAKAAAPAKSTTPTKPAATAKPGDTPAVVAGKAWLAANKLTDDKAFVSTLGSLWPTAPGTRDQWLQAREQFRYMEFVAVKSATAEKAELWLREPIMDSYLVATVAVQPGAPNKIASVQAAPSQQLPPGVSPPAKLPEAQWLAAIGARAAQDAKLDRFSGAVLIARNGKVLLQQAYGMADRAAKKPNAVDTQFRFGSMGKMFTAVAVMQLIESGKIDPNATVGRYIPTYGNAQIATSVRISHLLSHTGGTGDIFGPEYDRSKATLRDAKDYIALYQRREPQFSAGSQYAYSNYGFMLLGRIVELASGLNFDEYAQRYIFAPAGMTATGYLPESTKLPKRAVAYIGSGATVKRGDDTLPVRGTPAGGSYSTVGDLERFVVALTSGKLMKPATFEALMQGGVALPDGNRAPFDFGGDAPGIGKYFGHNGGAPGMNGQLVHFMQSGYTIIALANRNPPSGASGITRFAVNRLPAAAAPAKPAN